MALYRPPGVPLASTGGREPGAAGQGGTGLSRKGACENWGEEKLETLGPPFSPVGLVPVTWPPAGP